MAERAGGGANEIENQEAQMSHRILDIVAEDPEEDHVAGEMPEAGVDEGIGEVGQRFRHDFEPCASIAWPKAIAGI